MSTPENVDGSLTVTAEWNENTLMIAASGEVDLVTAPRLEEALNEGIRKNPDVLVLDLLTVEFLSSAGLSTLLRVNQAAGGATRLRIIANDATTRRPIELMGLDGELDVYSSRAEALAAPVR